MRFVCVVFAVLALAGCGRGASFREVCEQDLRSVLVAPSSFRVVSYDERTEPVSVRPEADVRRAYYAGINRAQIDGLAADLPPHEVHWLLAELQLAEGGYADGVLYQAAIGWRAQNALGVELANDSICTLAVPEGSGLSGRAEWALMIDGETVIERAP